MEGWSFGGVAAWAHHGLRRATRLAVAAWRRRVTALSLAACAIACSAPTGAPVVLTVHGDSVDGDIVVMARAGLGAWAEVRPRRLSSSISEFDLQVDGEFSYLVRCRDEIDRLMVKQVNAVTAETSRPEAFCRLPQRGPQPEFAVTGTMLQAGRVAVGSASQASGTGDWRFEVPATKAVRDLVAITSEHVFIRRALTVDRTIDLGLLDVEQMGAPLVAVPIAIDEPGLNTETYTQLTTANGTSLLLDLRSDLSLRAPAAGLLTATDRLDISVTTSEPGGRYRGVNQPYVGEAFAVSLLPWITGTALAAARTGIVPLSDLPVLDGSVLELELVDEQVGRSVASSRSWLLAMSADVLAFDLPPVFDAYGATGTIRRAVRVSTDEEMGVERWTSIVE